MICHTAHFNLAMAHRRSHVLTHHKDRPWTDAIVSNNTRQLLIHFSQRLSDVSATLDEAKIDPVLGSAITFLTIVVRRLFINLCFIVCFLKRSTMNIPCISRVSSDVHFAPKVTCVMVAPVEGALLTFICKLTSPPCKSLR